MPMALERPNPGKQMLVEPDKKASGRVVLTQPWNCWLGTSLEGGRKQNDSNKRVDGEDARRRSDGSPRRLDGEQER